MDDSGVTLSFQGQTFTVARHCVRKKVLAPAEAEASCDEVFEDLCRPAPSRNEPDPPPNPPLGSLGLYKRHFPPPPDACSPARAPLEKRARLGTGESQLDFGTPTLEPHCVATDDQGPLDSFDNACTQTQGPPTGRTGFEELSHRELHDLRKQGGFGRRDSKASLRTLLHKMDEVDHWRGLSRKRNRVSKDPAEFGDPDGEEHRVDKRVRRADAHKNFVTDKELLKQHGQWWAKEMQLFLGSPPNFWNKEIDIVATAEAADERNRILGQELPPEEAQLYEKDVLAADTRGLVARKQFKVFNPLEPGRCTKEVVGTRWVLTWKMVEGVKTVKARLAAKGYQDSDLEEGLVETSGSASLRSSHLQVISLAAIRGWRLRGIDIKNAFPQADGFGRDVFFQSPPEWPPGDSRRI